MDADSLLRALVEEMEERPASIAHQVRHNRIACRFCRAELKPVFNPLEEEPEDAACQLAHEPGCPFRDARRYLDGVSR